MSPTQKSGTAVTYIPVRSQLQTLRTRPLPPTSPGLPPWWPSLPRPHFCPCHLEGSCHLQLGFPSGSPGRGHLHPWLPYPPLSPRPPLSPAHSAAPDSPHVAGHAGAHPGSSPVASPWHPGIHPAGPSQGQRDPHFAFNSCH